MEEQEMDELLDRAGKVFWSMVEGKHFVVVWNYHHWWFTSEEEAWLFAAYWNLI